MNKASMCAALVALATGPLSTLAQVQRGEPVVVTATRTAVDPFEVPASIDRVEGDAIRAGRLQVNLSESLGVVPGLAIQNRNNYAQDLQLSIRGFGARSTFGIRGVRLYVDGIPATQPDGQGQLTNIDLSSVDRIEVLRGPFSALYGNSSGGVVQAFTESGSDVPRIVPSFAAGSDSTLRVGLKATGSLGDAKDGTSPRFGYVVSTSHFETDGPRDHSAARRDLGNAKLTYRLDAKTTVTLIANTVDLPRAQDPLGLSRAQFQNDPRSADPSALQFDTRKSFSQTQAGAIVEHELDAYNRVRVLVYGGSRTTQQFQSIPVAAQTPVTSAGGVIDLKRNYVGTDLRFTHRMQLASQPLSIVAGLATDRLDEHRRGFENFSGTGANRVLGVQGALRRDEDNDIRNVDEYLQASWTFAPRWTLDAGVRHSVVRFASNDRFVVGANPDDSGRVRYQATLPVAGLLFRATPAINLYATAGRGFETPTFNELSYRPDGASGLNFALKPAKSTSVEAGVKTRIALSSDSAAPSSIRANAAIFSTRTQDEIVTLTNVGGRSTFTNAGRTQRRGAELSAEWTWANDWRVQAAYTLLDAHYRDSFATCNATPCVRPTVVIPSGNRIPGVAGNSAYAELAYAPERGWRAGLEARHAGKIYVDDANSDAASRYAVLGARIGYLWRFARLSLESFARVDNITDRRYAGSVIVNEGNSRFFEPAQGRAYLFGATATVSLD